MEKNQYKPFNLLLTKKQKTKLERLAKKNTTSISQFLRDLINNLDK